MCGTPQRSRRMRTGPRSPAISIVPFTCGSGRRISRCQRTAAAEPINPADTAPPISPAFSALRVRSRLAMTSVYHVWLAGQELRVELLGSPCVREAMKKILPLALILVLLVGVASAHADARPDSEFGTKGKILLRDGMRAPNASALLPDGRVVVAQYRQMLAFLPSGQIDQGFGVGGTADLLVPSGSSTAAIADVVVDSQGRLVVVGSADSD